MTRIFSACARQAGKKKKSSVTMTCRETERFEDCCSFRFIIRRTKQTFCFPLLAFLAYLLLSSRVLYRLS